MAVTVNEQWRDALIRHQIGLFRVSGSIRNQIIELLNAVEADLAATIRERVAGANFFSTQGTRRLERLRKQVIAIRHAAFLRVGESLREELLTLSAAEGVYLTRAVSAVAPVLLSVGPPEPAVLRNIVTRQPFHGRLLRTWVQDLERADRKRIMDQIRIGIVQGEGNDAIARRVVGTTRMRGRDGVTGISRRQAVALVRTATNHVANAAKREFYKANAAVFKKEVYLATLDGNTTAICRSLDGKEFEVGLGPIPPLHIQCRSTRVAVLDDTLIGVRPAKPATTRGLLREYANRNGISPVRLRSQLPRGHKGRFDTFARGRLRELTGQVPSATTYQQWLSRQSAQFQNDVLGVTRGRLFRRGGLTLDRFVNRQGDELTLAQLARRDRDAFIAAGLDPGDF